MKSLLYKEFKLTIPWFLYLLILGFALFPLIPSFPDSASFMYAVCFYPLVFLGASKQTNNNDVYFSLTLPVSRKKIVLARIISIATLQLLLILCLSITSPLGSLIESTLNLQASETTKEVFAVGLGGDSFLALIGFTLVSLTVLDFIFFTLFYKGAKNFALPMFCSIIPFIILQTVFTIFLPISSEGFKNLFTVWKPVNQILTLLVGLLFYIIGHLITYIFASKSFESVDY